MLTKLKQMAVKPICLTVYRWVASDMTVICMSMNMAITQITNFLSR